MRPKKKVLLVDDDADFVEMNKVVLENNGYEVMTAHCGAACEDKVKATRPDLVVLDIAMHGVGDGVFVAHGLRRDEATKDIPIIVVSCINRALPNEIGPDPERLPVDAFLEKPVAPDVLLAQVETLLGRTGTQAE